MQANLALEQAPPIWVPFRFFFAAPLFGLLAAILLIAGGPEALASRWSAQTLALTHLLTLGFMGLVMCGATLQILPVLIGATTPRVQPVGLLIFVLLVTGTGGFVAALLQPVTLLMLTALTTLASGFGLFLIVVGIALWRSTSINATRTPMRLAMLALAITVILGVTLAIGTIYPTAAINLPLLTNTHLAWGLLGWTALLVIGVAYQVVPMFQITPVYPAWMTRFLAISLFSGLLTWSALYLLLDNKLPASLWMLLCLTGYTAFALTTLWLQYRRKRKVEDITLLFWRLGMSLAIAACLLWLAGLASPELADSRWQPLLLGTFLLPGFAVSVINGMLYKIVPFLVWFHLQHNKLAMAPDVRLTIPNMKRVIPVARTRQQFYVHCLAVMLLITAVAMPGWLAYAAGVTMGASFIFLWFNLLKAARLYNQYWQLLQQLAADKASA